MATTWYLAHNLVEMERATLIVFNSCSVGLNVGVKTRSQLESVLICIVDKTRT